MPESRFKKVFFPILIMTLVSACMTALLATANSLTQDRIESLASQADDASKRAILPAASTFVELAPPEGHKDVLSVFEGKDASGKSVGMILVTHSRGYGGLISVMTGFDQDRSILEVLIVKDDETPGLGKKVREDAFLSAYSGKDASLVFTVKPDDPTRAHIDSVAGATISSRGVTDAVNKACSAYQSLVGGKN